MLKDSFKKGVVVFPTDTVLGIGANLEDTLSLRKLFKLKGREAKEKPFVIFVSSLEQAKQFALISKKQEDILKKYWPGAFTFILEKKADVLDKELFPLPTIGLRMPKLDFYLNEITIPMAVTSCNKTGKKIANDITEANNIFNDKVDYYCKANYSQAGIPSTIVNLTTNPATILRQGGLEFKEI